MKTVLVAINAKYIHSNLAVYSLRSYARTFGYEPELLEFTINQQKDQIFKGIYEAKPDLLFFPAILEPFLCRRDYRGHQKNPAKGYDLGRRMEVSYDAQNFKTTSE